MFRHNMGRLDRSLRFIAGVAIILIGALALTWWQSTLGGILLLVLASVLLGTSLTGVCPAYIPCGISTVGRPHKPDNPAAAC